ncbi:MAG TPA: hypothetical protein DIT07_11040 [Sphingobacteriaceae bacterium]|nr:hypothetical protein [Sphingobacteriaceae bacterium]
MKICIWCSKSEEHAFFTKKAHSFPDSLGGKSICDNVCDSCNHYFGSPTIHGPSVEVVFKEILNLSKYLLLTYAKQKGLKRFKSEYFKFNLNGGSIRLKPRYSLRPLFQKRLGRQFKRGMFKVFLEEREIQRGDAMDPRFDFIREFARYDLSDYPIYYLKPKLPAIFYSAPDTIKPTIRFTKHSDTIDEKYRVFDYTIMAHTFVIPTSKMHSLVADNYRNYLVDSDNPFGSHLIEIKNVSDVDFTFSYMDSTAN